MYVPFYTDYLRRFTRRTIDKETQIIDGETSFTVCNGYCPDVVDSTFRPIWRSATPFETYIPEGCGHALNLCTGAPDVFAKMFGFLAENGL